MRRKCKTIEERFWPKVLKLKGGCWFWLAFIDKAGYARIHGTGRDSEVLYAHIFSYELHNGPVPVGLELDHTCRHRWCVNPTHLEPVPHRINALRGMAPTVVIHRSGRCSRNHKRTEENVYWIKNKPGKWQCRECNRIRKRRSYARKDRRADTFAKETH